MSSISKCRRFQLFFVLFASHAWLQECQGRDLGSLYENERRSWVEPLAWRPRAFLYHNFITTEEADHIIAMAKPFMKRSTVVGSEGGGHVHDIRTSYGTFIKRRQDDIIAGVEERVARWTHLNMTHQEDMQILRYGIGQKYGAHWDSLDYKGAPRVATVLLYLNDVEEGGETAFPKDSQWLDPSLPQRLGPFSPCAEGNVAAKPRKGDALLFFSLLPGGQPDDSSMHTGCPVLRGIKWTATLWIHTQPFRPESLGEPPDQMALPEDCVDVHPNCNNWAEEGECEKNPDFMKGDSGYLGKCRKTCSACEVCGSSDVACKNRNRVRQGYLPLEEL